MLQKPWSKQPFALTALEQNPLQETHLWAPQVIRQGGRYYMYYCAGGSDHTRYQINLATSKDLKNWQRHPGNPMVVDGYDARDPMIMRQGDRWLLYYTATSEPAGGYHVVACVTSRNLTSWTDRQIVFTDNDIGTSAGSTESPFVVRRGSSYYLFIGPRQGYVGTEVFVSQDPFYWSANDRVGFIPAHAAELVRDVDGNWYVSHAGWGQGGVFLAPLKWLDGLDQAETSLPVPDAYQ